MSPYETAVLTDLHRWQQQMRRPPSAANRLTRSVQTRLNGLIPERVHEVVTAAIKHMTRAVLLGAEYTSPRALLNVSLEERETAVRHRIDIYRKTGAAEGGVTGAGGLLLGLADFPLLLSLKMKMLYDIAALYGHSVTDYRERLYLMHIFQLAFSGQAHRRDVFSRMENWAAYSASLPDDIHQFDWRTFQQEYRDYIDLAKLLQLIPGIGAVVGVVVNYRLIDQLGQTAMNAYRLRWAAGQRETDAVDQRRLPA